jgi:hypothetical protein
MLLKTGLEGHILRHIPRCKFAPNSLTMFASAAPKNLLVLRPAFTLFYIYYAINILWTEM